MSTFIKTTCPVKEIPSEAEQIEAYLAFRSRRNDVEWWCDARKSWQPLDPQAGLGADTLIRIKKKPAKVTRQLKQGEIIPGDWVRHPSGKEICLVLGTHATDIFIYHGRVSYDYLLHMKWEFSQDQGKTWKPCSITE